MANLSAFGYFSYSAALGLIPGVDPVGGWLVEPCLPNGNISYSNQWCLETSCMKKTIQGIRWAPKVQLWTHPSLIPQIFILQCPWLDQLLKRLPNNFLILKNLNILKEMRRKHNCKGRKGIRENLTKLKILEKYPEESLVV